MVTVRNSKPSPLGVVCDFDGTATLLDIGDEISRHFGGIPHWEAEKARFLSGEQNTRQIIEGIYKHVYATEAEVRAFAKEVARLRPGFADLVQSCRDRGAPFILASGGLRQYVEAALEAQLPQDLREHIEVRANEARFGTPHLSVDFPWDARSREMGCEVCGSCKRVAVSDLRQGGASWILGIGDGFADRCLVQFADQAFAKQGSYLERHCTANQIAHEPFESLARAAQVVREYPAS